MLDHIGLYNQLGAADFLWDIKRPADTNTRMVTICAKDRPGLISKIAGVFTLNNIDILDVQVFTWRNNIALDIFEVTPPPDQIMEAEKWDRTEKNLVAALSGELNPAAALTIIEVFTYDFPGLLFGITDALYQCELNIWVAKIATKADQVVDVFYVWDLNGDKVDSPDQVDLIKAAILERLPTME